MDNFKCLIAFSCDVLNKKDTNVSVDFIDDYETLRKELFKSMKIVKKFKEEFKLANLEQVELIMRLDKSNKKNEFLRNQFSSQEEKMKSLEQKIAESGAKFDNLSNTKLAVDNKFVSVFFLLKPKDDKVYIPPLKRNHKKNAYFARLDTDKSSDVGAKILNLCLNLLLECKRNLFLCLPITFVVLLVTLDQIVLC